MFSLSENGTFTTDIPVGKDAGSYTVYYYIDGDKNHRDTDVQSVAVTIERRIVKLRSADDCKIYDGTALENKTVSVIEGSMAEGEAFVFAFTGTQTALGASSNTFTVTEEGTAKTTNYTITCEYGTLKVSLSTTLGDSLAEITEDNVTSDYREEIENTIGEIDDYLDMDPTDVETEVLNVLKDRLEELIHRLDEVKEAMESETITSTDGISKNNATYKDEQALTDAKEAIQKLLEDYDGNLTEGEKQMLNEKLSRINDALDEIARLGVPPTGDTTTPAVYIALLALSLIGAAVLCVCGKRKIRIS